MLRLLDLIHRHALGNKVARSSSTSMSLGGREVEPHVCSNKILLHSLPDKVHDAKIVLRRRLTTIRSPLIPVRRSQVVLLDTPPGLVAESQVELRLRIVHVSGLAETPDGLLGIRRYALTIEVHEAKVVLCRRVTLASSPVKPLRGFDKVLRHSTAVVVRQTKLELRVPVSLLCPLKEGLDLLRVGDVIALRYCGKYKAESDADDYGPLQNPIEALHHCFLMTMQYVSTPRVARVGGTVKFELV